MPSSTWPALRSTLAVVTTSTMGAPDGERDFEVAQVIRHVKAVERSLAQPVQVEEMSLLGIVVGAEDEDARRRPGADHVVDDAAQRAQLIDVVLVGQLVDVAADLVAQHAALRHP